MAGSPVARDLPGVVEDQAGHHRGGPASEHAELVGVRPGIEIAAYDGEVTAPGPFLDEPGQLTHLRLPHRAPVQRVVEHDHEQLNGPALAIQQGEERGPSPGSAVARQRTALVRGNRPARHQADPGYPVLGTAVTGEHAVPESEPPGDQPGLVRTPVGPGLHQADDVQHRGHQAFLEAGLPFGPVAVPSPDVQVTIRIVVSTTGP